MAARGGKHQRKATVYVGTYPAGKLAGFMGVWWKGRHTQQAKRRHEPYTARVGLRNWATRAAFNSRYPHNARRVPRQAFKVVGPAGFLN